MMKTEKFREQHVVILDIARKISAALNTDQLRYNPDEMFELVTEFAGNVKLHLVLEDDVLYPLLLEHKDSEIRTLAQKYMNEHGKLKDVILEYASKWANSIEIQRNPKEFIEHTRSIFNLVKNRIYNEDNDLFVVVDNVNSDS